MPVSRTFEIYWIYRQITNLRYKKFKYSSRTQTLVFRESGFIELLVLAIHASIV